ncbi:protein OS-9 isoform X2 [Cinnamomum micranthum f. kanehirae]|uniref:Protein OS-9 isoform X2 n=1 Tax=Cinnamomum micranthum f. kanehirae TaxID=337451 RepID=A0A3S3M6M4_9MAGN|nr:protein OS-9 isoform X2 [Cinnamomum micranthum f. kanehirae]
MTTNASQLLINSFHSSPPLRFYLSSAMALPIQSTVTTTAPPLTLLITTTETPFPNQSSSLNGRGQEGSLLTMLMWFGDEIEIFRHWMRPQCISCGNTQGEGLGSFYQCKGKRSSCLNSVLFKKKKQFASLFFRRNKYLAEHIFSAHTGRSFGRSSREPKYKIEFHPLDSPLHPMCKPSIFEPWVLEVSLLEGGE